MGASYHVQTTRQGSFLAEEMVIVLAHRKYFLIHRHDYLVLISPNFDLSSHDSHYLKSMVLVAWDRKFKPILGVKLRCNLSWPRTSQPSSNFICDDCLKLSRYLLFASNVPETWNSHVLPSQLNGNGTLESYEKF